MNAKIGERRYLARLQIAQICMQCALQACEKLLTFSGSSEERYLLVVGMYTLYAKPFTQNEGLGNLSTDIVPEELRDEHRLAVNLRHQNYAHTDVSEKTSLRASSGEILVKAHLTKSPGQCTFGYSTILPNENGLQNFQRLAASVLENLLQRISDFASRYYSDMEGLADGRYEVDVSTEEDAPLFKKIAI